MFFFVLHYVLKVFEMIFISINKNAASENSSVVSKNSKIKDSNRVTKIISNNL